LGFPVFAGMGALTVHHDHVIDVPRLVPSRRVDGIALDGNDILVKVNAGGHDALCRLDMSADHTVFYKSYYDLYKDELDKAGKPRTVKLSGVGGTRSHTSLRLTKLQLKVAGRQISLEHIYVFTDKVLGQDYLQCSLGQDIFKDYRSYTINLQAMSLTLD